MSADQRGECTKDTPVELLAVLLRLQELTALRRVVVLEVRLDRLVLLVEKSEVGNEVLDDVHCNASRRREYRGEARSCGEGTRLTVR